MEKNLKYSSSVMFSALSGLLFFSIMVQSALKKNQGQRTTEEQTFISSRCQVGKGVWVLSLLFLVALILAEWWGISGFLSFAQGVAYLLFTVLSISLLMIVSGVSFQMTRISQTTAQKKQMLHVFIPLLSSYEWFRSKRFERPYRWAKEAQLWLVGIWLLLFLLPSWLPGMVMFSFLFLRLGFLFFGYDFISQAQKIGLHRSFKVYPEELCSLPLVYFQALLAEWRKRPFNIQEALAKYQKSYSAPWSRKFILLSLILILPLLGFLFRERWKMGLWRKLMPFLRGLGRLLLLKRTQTPIPKPPLISELTPQK